MKIKEIYQWAKEHEVTNLMTRIDHLVYDGKLTWDDDDSKLWSMPSHERQYGHITENQKNYNEADELCVCKEEQCECKSYSELLKEETSEIEGIVTDEHKAISDNPCHIVTRTMTFKEGIRGALNKSQVSEYCKVVIPKE